MRNGTRGCFCGSTPESRRDRSYRARRRCSEPLALSGGGVTQVRGFESGGVGCQIGGGPAQGHVAVDEHQGLIGHLQSESDVLFDEYDGGVGLVRDAADHRHE